MNRFFLVVQREYLERVKKKSFIFTTLLMPLLMIILMVAPTLIMVFSTPEKLTIGVVDTSGRIYPYLESDETVHFVQLTETPSGKASISGDSIDGYIVIAADIIDKKSPERVDMMLNGSSNIQLESQISSQINHAIETERLLNYNINDLPSILDNVKSDVSINIMRLDQDEEKTMPTEISVALGIFISMLLYFFLLLYGSQVMQSIIEEKSSRVLEVIVSSIKPTQLLTGKIAGICLVAVTQIMIWTICIVTLSAVVLPAIMPGELLTNVQAMQAGSSLPENVDLELVNTIATFTNPIYIATLMAWLLVFLIGGFLLYASLFAAVGSAVENIQDASQLQTFVIVPIIIAMLASMSVASSPNSTFIQWLSIIPFTSPMVMMARIPFGIPAWQPIVAIVVLYASIFATVWCAAKIYRVGIFMYGKKPNIREIIRWISYK